MTRFHEFVDVFEKWIEDPKNKNCPKILIMDKIVNANLSAYRVSASIVENIITKVEK